MGNEWGSKDDEGQKHVRSFGTESTLVMWYRRSPNGLEHGPMLTEKNVPKRWTLPRNVGLVVSPVQGAISVFGEGRG